MSLVRPRYWIIDGVRYRVSWDGGSYLAVVDATEEHVCRIFAHGTRWIASGFPGKKWASAKQALEYTLMMRNQ